MARDPEIALRKQLAALDRANILLRQGKIRLYQDALQGVLPTFLPDYPLRFLMMLRRPNRATVDSMIQWGREHGQEPDLTIDVEGNVSWEGEDLGRIIARDRQTLTGIGESLIDLYTVSIMEMHYDDGAKTPLYIALEMVRPELWIDSRGILCSPDDPQGEVGSQPAEAPPIPIARALEDELRRQGGDEPRLARGSG
jgi:hypothetical protein